MRVSILLFGVNLVLGVKSKRIKKFVNVQKKLAFVIKMFLPILSTELIHAFVLYLVLILAN